MTLLVTGGAGSLGSNLVDHWQNRFKNIVVIDSFATSKPESLPPLENLVLVRGDISDSKLLQELFETHKPSVVVHAAASYKDPHNLKADAATNIMGAIELAKLLPIYKPRLVINFQTALVYGKPLRVPIPVNHQVAPITSYGISKLAGELYLMNCGWPVLSFRLANITGPRLAIGPIPTFYRNILEGKECNVSTARRDFLDMADFLDLMDKTLDSKVKSGIFNVSTGVGNSIQEIFDSVKNHLNRPELQPASVFEPGPDDIKEVVLDPSLTNLAFNWEPKYPFESVIRRMLEWYNEHGITDIYSHIKE
jgi:nucleoside-diphosphate-sugar epimerase